MQLSKLIDPRFKKVIIALQSAVIPLKGAYKLKGVVKAIDDELNKYEEFRKEALNKFGSKDDKGELIQDDKGNVKFEEASLKDFLKQLQELQDLDVSIPKLKIEDLGENVNISVEDLFLIEDLLD